MSRTFRRRRHRYEYRHVLRVWIPPAPFWSWDLLDRHSPEGRRAIARFHSDKEVTMGGAAPHWYRRTHDHRIRTVNDRELRRWLADDGYDPVFDVRHRHGANWSWW
jgi:hypothetical protein